MKTLVAAALLLTASVSHAANIVDDFNRPDAPTLGSGWTAQAGSAAISGNTATSYAAPFERSLLTWNGAGADTVSFDVHANGLGVAYVGAVLNYGNGHSYLIKVQTIGAQGFAAYGFYIDNNIVAGGPFALLNSDFMDGHVVMQVINGHARLQVTPTAGAAQNYAFNYNSTGSVGPAFDGTSVGLGFDKTRADAFAYADNFALGGSFVPEPASWALMIAGFGLIGGSLRVKRRAAAPAAA